MKEFSAKLQEQFNKMCKTGKLFRSSISGGELWGKYLTSFPDDPIFRDPQSSSHNCNNCNNFIRRYGNIVSINEKLEIESIFDVQITGEYEKVAKNLSQILRNQPIKEVFFETYQELNSLPYESCNPKNKVFRLGIAQNHKIYTKEEVDKFGVVKAGEIYTFDHFHLDLPKEFVDMNGKSVEAIMGEFRESKTVFQRAMKEIPEDTLSLVSDLISQGSLLNGATYLPKISQFLELKRQYDKLSAAQQDNWCWIVSYKLPVARFRNELIGTLCVELAEGEELNKACENWNKRVDPANYMKAVAPITKRQIEEARKFVEVNGYVESFDRRLATIEDIKVSEILHSNVGKGEIKPVSMFDSIKPAVSTRHKRSEFNGIQEVDIEKFMKEILPTCTSVEAFLHNLHEGNMVTLTTANIKDSKPIFKWSNNYSWTYNGNLAGKSELSKKVEERGGKTDGVFRFSHSWNELEPNQSLMDLHVFMPGCDLPNQNTGGPDINGRRVGWNKRTDPISRGNQDVDYTSEAPVGYIPVENITFPHLKGMPEGVYTCMIHNWNFRKTGGRGRAEIAFGGNVYQYIYPKTKNHQWITIAEVTLKNGVFSIEHILPPENESSKEIYGLETNNFHKVNLICLSPNFWGENKVGHKHYFFMLQNCKNPDPVRGFHNENLLSELTAHRKVLDVLGATNMIPSSDKQLSGLGFNATVPDELIVRLSGSHNRTLKIKF